MRKLDPFGVLVGTIPLWLPVPSIVRLIGLVVFCFCLSHLLIKGKQSPFVLNVVICLYILWIGTVLALNPIDKLVVATATPEAKSTSVKEENPIIEELKEAKEESSPTRKEDNLPASEQSAALENSTKTPQKLEDATSPLIVTFLREARTRIPQTNQPYPPKVKQFARLRVTNSEKQTIHNVRLTLTSLANEEVRWTLLPTTTLTLFKIPHPAYVPETVTLNPGDDQFFDVLVECNGKFCPDGIVAVPTY